MSLKAQQNQRGPVYITKRSTKDDNGLLHYQVHHPVTVGKNGKWSTLTRECKLCKEKRVKKHLLGHYCLTCGDLFAFSGQISIIMDEIASEIMLQQ
jgi:hypothetical protein